MEYEVLEAHDSIAGDRWLVEAIDHDSEGEIYAAAFSGPGAEERAREYRAFKQAQVASA